jgi:hypothetical protein
MGCRPSNIRSNLTQDQPHQIIGSTQLQADQIVVLGDNVYLPTREGDGESAIIEISVQDKKIHVYRGLKQSMLRTGIS